MGNGLCQCNGPNKQRNDLEKALKNEAMDKTKLNQLSQDESDNENEISSKYAVEEEINKDSNKQLMRSLTDISDINYPCSYDTHHEKQQKFTLISQSRDHLITPTSTRTNDNEDDRDHHLFSKLCISSKTLSLFNENKNNKYKFDYCSSLQIVHCDLSVITNNAHKFNMLRHLEIFKPKPDPKAPKGSQTNLFLIINDILNELSATLLSFKLELAAIEETHKNGCFGGGILNIPSNIEWLNLKNVECQIDISKCCNLIGIQLFEHVQYEKIIWPQFENKKLIPFGLFCDGSGEDKNEWRNASIDNDINVKFICLYKEKQKQSEEKELVGKEIIKNSRSIQLNADQNIRKCKFDIEDNRKCIILNDDECGNGKLYENIMRYKFKGDFKLKSQKLMEYEDCEWIKRIGMI